MPSIRKELYPLTRTYKQAAEAKAAESDKNACAVIAVSIVANIPFAEAAKLFEAKGRKKGRGVLPRITKAVLDELGFDLVSVKPSHFINQYPELHRQALKSVTNHHPDRFPSAFKDGNTYLFSNRDHVFAVVDGVVHDHSRGTRRKVIHIEKVVPKR